MTEFSLDIDERLEREDGELSDESDEPEERQIRGGDSSLEFLGATTVTSEMEIDRVLEEAKQELAEKQAQGCASGSTVIESPIVAAQNNIKNMLDLDFIATIDAPSTETVEESDDLRMAALNSMKTNGQEEGEIREQPRIFPPESPDSPLRPRLFDRFQLPGPSPEFPRRFPTMNSLSPLLGGASGPPEQQQQQRPPSSYTYHHHQQQLQPGPPPPAAQSRRYQSNQPRPDWQQPITRGLFGPSPPAAGAQQEYERRRSSRNSRRTPSPQQPVREREKRRSRQRQKRRSSNNYRSTSRDRKNERKTREPRHRRSEESSAPPTTVTSEQSNQEVARGENRPSRFSDAVRSRAAAQLTAERDHLMFIFGHQQPVGESIFASSSTSAAAAAAVARRGDNHELVAMDVVDSSPEERSGPATPAPVPALPPPGLLFEAPAISVPGGGGTLPGPRPSEDELHLRKMLMEQMKKTKKGGKPDEQDRQAEEYRTKKAELGQLDEVVRTRADRIEQLDSQRQLLLHQLDETMAQLTVCHREYWQARETRDQLRPAVERLEAEHMLRLAKKQPLRGWKGRIEDQAAQLAAVALAAHGRLFPTPPSQPQVAVLPQPVTPSPAALLPPPPAAAAASPAPTPQSTRRSGEGRDVVAQAKDKQQPQQPAQPNRGSEEDMDVSTTPLYSAEEENEIQLRQILLRKQQTRRATTPAKTTPPSRKAAEPLLLPKVTVTSSSSGGDGGGGGRSRIVVLESPASPEPSPKRKRRPSMSAELPKTPKMTTIAAAAKLPKYSPRSPEIASSPLHFAAEEYGPAVPTELEHMAKEREVPQVLLTGKLHDLRRLGIPLRLLPLAGLTIPSDVEIEREICPFALTGKCKDVDCNHRHLNEDKLKLRELVSMILWHAPHLSGRPHYEDHSLQVDYSLGMMGPEEDRHAFIRRFLKPLILASGILSSGAVKETPLLNGN